MIGHLIGLLIFIFLLGYLVYDWMENNEWCSFLEYFDFIDPPSFLYYAFSFWITAAIIAGGITFLVFCINDLTILVDADEPAFAVKSYVESIQ